MEFKLRDGAKGDSVLKEFGFEFMKKFPITGFAYQGLKMERDLEDKGYSGLGAIKEGLEFITQGLYTTFFGLILSMPQGGFKEIDRQRETKLGVEAALNARESHKSNNEYNRIRSELESMADKDGNGLSPLERSDAWKSMGIDPIYARPTTEQMQDYLDKSK